MRFCGTLSVFSNFVVQRCEPKPGRLGGAYWAPRSIQPCTGSLRLERLSRGLRRYRGNPGAILVIECATPETRFTRCEPAYSPQNNEKHRQVSRRCASQNQKAGAFRHRLFNSGPVTLFVTLSESLLRHTRVIHSRELQAPPKRENLQRDQQNVKTIEQCLWTKIKDDMDQPERFLNSFKSPKYTEPDLHHFNGLR